MKLPRQIDSLASFSAPQKDCLFKNPFSIGTIKQLHAHLIRTQQHTEPSAMSDVIRSYASSAATLDRARLVFDHIELPTLFIWNDIIRGYSKSDRPSEAIYLFDQMRERGFHGNNLTLLYMFKVFARVQDIVGGRKGHVHVVKLGYESYLYVCNALIYMYASCGELGFARKLFDEMPERDLVSWNSLICGYSQCCKFDEVLGLFDAMRKAAVKADAVTMVKVLLACSHIDDMALADSMIKYIDENQVEIDVYLGNTMIDLYGQVGSVKLAQEVFDHMAERNIVSWNAMIMGYARAGDLIRARGLFDQMPKRDVISWTSMITGYSQANQFTDAVKLFEEMMVAEVKPDKITVASVLSACAHLGLLDVGKGVHKYICKNHIKIDIVVGNALIDMYCKCGSCEEAIQVFQEMKDKDSVSWTSIISGLAVNGFSNHALVLFSLMLREGVQPSHGTFVGILLACAHAGLVDEGLKYFQSMERDYKLVPEMKHYGCIVDLLSRSGKLDKAYQFIKQMPVDADVVVWRILLSACKLHGNVVLAEITSSRLLELDPSNSGNYVLSANSFAASDKWGDAMKMRELMEKGDVQKPFGWSMIELNGETSNKFQDYPSLLFPRRKPLSVSSDKSNFSMSSEFEKG